MKLNTHGSLFDHACQIKDMKFSGFSPTTLRYTCTECGGHLVLKLDRDRWEDAFGEKPSFRLSKKVLQSLEEIGAEPLIASDEIDAATEEFATLTAQQKFHWEPADEDEEDFDEEDDLEEGHESGAEDDLEEGHESGAEDDLEEGHESGAEDDLEDEEVRTGE